MANIDVVPKQRSNAWIWIVLAVIVVAAVVWAMNRKSVHTGAQLQPAAAHLASVSPATPTLRLVA